VANWTIDTLEDALGPSWPVDAVEQFDELPIPLILAGGHTLAFVQTVDLALRLRLLESVEGFARARKELRGNRELGRVLHFSFQATLCGLARKRGWGVRLEAGDPPADLWFEARGRRTTVEARVLGRSRSDRELHSAVDYAIDRLRTVTSRLGVWVTGELEDAPSDADLDEVVAWIEQCAGFVRRGGAVPRYTKAPFKLELIQMEDAHGRRLSSPVGEENLLPRLLNTLADKVQRMQKSGADWLCVENYTGIFAFTEWGLWPMPRKVAALEHEIGAAFPDKPIAGIVVCSGASHFNGTINEEAAETSTGAIGLRYAVAPWRAREALVIPLRDAGAAADWRQLFEAEHDWFAWALDEMGLPTFEEIMAQPGEW
jgi:hypothetical protein